jgi:hypothetical protein
VEERNKSLFLFFFQVFVFSIVFWGWGLLHPVELLPGLPISALGAFTPALSAIILIYKKDRLPGVFTCSVVPSIFNASNDRRICESILQTA